jgi:hypothetical protein
VDRVVAHHHLFNSYLKKFLNYHDDLILAKIDECHEDEGLKNRYKDEHQRILIGLFWIMHESYYFMDNAFDNVVMRDIANGMLVAAKEELQIPDFCLFTHNYSPTTENDPSHDRTVEFHHKAVKSTEDLLKTLINYRPYQGKTETGYTAKYKANYDLKKKEWTHINAHLLECAEAFTNAFITYSETYDVLGASPQNRYAIEYAAIKTNYEYQLYTNAKGGFFANLCKSVGLKT